MSLDNELENWREGWKSRAATPVGVPTDLLNQAIRQEARLRRNFAIEMAMGAFFLAGSLAFALWDRTTETILWAACVWLSTLFATVFSFRNSRNLWQASTQSVSDYVSLYRERSTSTLRAVGFGRGFLVVQGSISTAWFTIDLFAGRISVSRYSFALLLIVAFSVSFLWVFARLRKQALAELKSIGEEPSSFAV